MLLYGNCIREEESARLPDYSTAHKANIFHVNSAEYEFGWDQKRFYNSISTAIVNFHSKPLAMFVRLSTKIGADGWDCVGGAVNLHAHFHEPWVVCWVGKRRDLVLIHPLQALFASSTSVWRPKASFRCRRLKKRFTFLLLFVLLCLSLACCAGWRWKREKNHFRHHQQEHKTCFKLLERRPRNLLWRRGIEICV